MPTIQHYDWGDRSFIASLQSRAPSGEPEAELWMGAHERSPSMLAHAGVGLDEAIARDPVATLGSSVHQAFGALPFLAKILASAHPLSIQTHPSTAQAQAGFDRETRLGIPRMSPNRVYPDPSHKPELLCALTPFEAKCGFRPLDDARALFDLLGGSADRDRQLGLIIERLAQPGAGCDVYHDVLAWLLRGGTPVDELVAATVRAAAAAGDGPFRRELTWCAPIAARHPGDVGVVVGLLLNHVALDPGQAMFLGAGNLHSYLRGAGVELMANSDNVIRGGLTSKHVAVEELLSVVDTTPAEPVVQHASGPLHRFDAPVADFSLTRVALADPVRIEIAGPEIVIVTEGSAVLVDHLGTPLHAASGAPVWVPASDRGYLISGSGTAYRAGVGLVAARS